jgi:hypothetical protein
MYLSVYPRDVATEGRNRGLTWQKKAIAPQTRAYWADPLTPARGLWPGEICESMPIH